MSNYTETFTSENGDVTDASELETEFDKIATAIATKLDDDGSGVMTGNLNMGTNSITAVVDPTSAQHAATKNYVDIGIQANYATFPNTTVAASEAVEDTLAITIPAAWNTFNVELIYTGSLDSTNTTATQVTVRFRDGATTGDTLISANSGIVQTDGSAPDPELIPIALFGFLTAETLTGARTFAITSDHGGGAADLINNYWGVRAYRLT